MPVTKIIQDSSDSSNTAVPPPSRGYFEQFNQCVDQLRPHAKSYNDMKRILALYATLDGLIISYSAFKLYFDLFASEGSSSSDELHDWMMSPSGYKTIISGSFTIIILSLINNLFSDKEEKTGNETKDTINSIDHAFKTISKNQYIKNLALSWYYLRDIFKGLKFSYKGIRSTLQILNYYEFNMQSILVNLSIGIGILAAGNRVLYRMTILEKRKKYVLDNKADLKNARSLGCGYVFCETELNTLVNSELNEKTLYLEIDKTKKIIRCTTKSNKKEFVEIDLSEISDEFVDENKKQILLKNLTIGHLEKHYSQLILAKLLANTNNKIIDSTNTQIEREKIKKKLDQQKLPSQFLAMSSAIFSGLVDGLYTYMGLLCIVTLTPQLLAAMMFCSIIFTIARVINRCTEEYEYQQEWLLSQYRVEEILLAQELREAIWRAQSNSISNSARDLPPPSLNTGMGRSVNDILVDSQLLREKIKSTIVHSSFRAGFNGLRSGLYVYSAISSVIFAISAFLAMLQIALSPWILAVGIFIGVVSLVGFFKYSLESNQQHLEQQMPKEAKIGSNFQFLASVLRLKNNGSKAINSEIEHDLTYFQETMVVQKSPQSPIQEVSEIARSGFSGLAKGWKAIDFLLNPFLVAGEKGHYQETQLMGCLGFLLSLVYSYSYTTRAFGKQLKPLDKKIDNQELPSEKKITQVSNTDTSSPTPIPTPMSRLSTSPSHLTTPIGSSALSENSLFDKPTPTEIDSPNINTETTTYTPPPPNSPDTVGRFWQFFSSPSPSRVDLTAELAPAP